MNVPLYCTAQGLGPGFYLRWEPTDNTRRSRFLTEKFLENFGDLEVLLSLPPGEIARVLARIPVIKRTDSAFFEPATVFPRFVENLSLQEFGQTLPDKKLQPRVIFQASYNRIIKL